MDDKRIKILSEASVVKAIFTMSLPVVMGMMVQVIYNLIDVFFIGKLKDPNQLAAANITTPLFMIMMALAGIVGTGAASYISRCLGEKNYEQANKTLSTGVVICVGMGLLVTVFASFFGSAIVNSLGASSATFPFAYDYSIVLFIGSTFIMCNFTMGQLLRSEGAAMPAMIGMMIGTLGNIALDPIFIFGFNMGIKGAAIATVLGNLCSLIFYILYYARGKSLVKINPKQISLDRTVWKEIFVIGTPASLSQFLMSIAMILCNNIAVTYGDFTVAGMGVASKIMTIGTFIFMGFAAGCQPLVGYNYGAKSFQRVKKIILQGMLITSSIGITLTIIFGIFAKSLISFFTPIPEIIDQGTVILRALMLSLPTLGALMIATTTVQAMGKAIASLLLSISRQGVFYIPLLYIMNKLFAFNGLIFAQPITDACMVVFASIILLFILKKVESQIQLQQEEVRLQNAFSDSNH